MPLVRHYRLLRLIGGDRPWAIAAESIEDPGVWAVIEQHDTRAHAQMGLAILMGGPNAHRENRRLTTSTGGRPYSTNPKPATIARRIRRVTSGR